MLEVLAIFAKPPHPGRVKTRLTPPLTPAEAASFQEAALRDVVGQALRHHADVRICYDAAPGAAAYFEEAFPALPHLPQRGNDLGKRLHNAFASLFATGVERVSIIGADAPTLPDTHLSGRFRGDGSREPVVGPTLDGGYYLIGLHRETWPRAAVLFESIPWSTDRVCEITLDRARTAGLEPILLPAWYDIDTVEDLVAAARDARPDSHLARLLAQGGWSSKLASPLDDPAKSGGHSMSGSPPANSLG